MTKNLPKASPVNETNQGMAAPERGRLNDFSEIAIKGIPHSSFLRRQESISSTVSGWPTSYFSGNGFRLSPE
jgi:hypothetical protein